MPGLAAQPSPPNRPLFFPLFGLCPQFPRKFALGEIPAGLSWTKSAFPLCASLRPSRGRPQPPWRLGGAWRGLEGSSELGVGAGNGEGGREGEMWRGSERMKWP